MLADKLGIHAFELDHTLYQWGRNAVKSGKASATKGATAGASVRRKVATTPLSSEEILIRLMEYWRNEPPRKLTVERQRVLAGILSGYGGTWLPVSHFRPEHLKDMELRNKDAYPVVKALLCGVMEKIDDRLQLKRGIVLGVRVLP